MRLSQRLTATALLATSSLSFAQSFPIEHFYAGIGINRNDIDVNRVDDATGLQILVGYEFEQGVQNTPALVFAAEVGYLDTGDFDGPGNFEIDDAKGIWANGVATYNINENFAALGRAGLDFGDDDGLMIGFGGQFEFNDAFGVRLEYVIRDDIDSLQLNGIYYFE